MHKQQVNDNFIWSQASMQKLQVKHKACGPRPVVLTNSDQQDMTSICGEVHKHFPHNVSVKSVWWH